MEWDACHFMNLAQLGLASSKGALAVTNDCLATSGFLTQGTRQLRIGKIQIDLARIPKQSSKSCKPSSMMAQWVFGPFGLRMSLPCMRPRGSRSGSFRPGWYGATRVIRWMTAHNLLLSVELDGKMGNNTASQYMM